MRKTAFFLILTLLTPLFGLSAAEAKSRPSPGDILRVSAFIACSNPPDTAISKASIWKAVPGFGNSYTYSGYGPLKGAHWGTARANYWQITYYSTYAVVWLESVYPYVHWNCSNDIFGNNFRISYDTVRLMAKHMP